MGADGGFIFCEVVIGFHNFRSRGCAGLVFVFGVWGFRGLSFGGLSLGSGTQGLGLRGLRFRV